MSGMSLFFCIGIYNKVIKNDLEVRIPSQCYQMSRSEHGMQAGHLLIINGRLPFPGVENADV